MAEIILFHGSLGIIRKPEFGRGKSNNDYGLGFYCTQSIELAKEWSVQNPLQDGFVNEYSLETNGLMVLNLNEQEYTILNWLSVLVKHRDFRVSTPIAKQGKEYLVKNFYVPVEDYDIIVGYRADDSYFSFARSFISNELSLRQLSYAMRLGKLGEQYVLKSEKSFSQIKFIAAYKALSNEYFKKRAERNEAANAAFKKELENSDIDGIFMRDIIRENIKNDDTRLR